MLLADKLRKARKKAGLSMSQVARESWELVAKKNDLDQRGLITQGYISRLESGKETNPSLMKLITLCGIYKIKPATLFPARMH